MLRKLNPSLRRNKWKTGLLLLVLTACSGHEPIDRHTATKVLNIGHAGMGFQSVINPFNFLPDNSMGSIRKAMALGADGVEVDVQMSKDSILILYHDKKLETKTGKKGCINELLAKDVIGTPYRAGTPFDWLHHESIISLDSLLSEFSRKDTFPWIYLDIHSYNYCDTANGYGEIAVFARALARALEERNVPREKIRPTSTHPPLLLEIRKADPALKLLYEEDVSFERARGRLNDYEFDGIVLKISLIPSVEEMKWLREKKQEIVFFGGKSQSTLYEMLGKGPDVMQVNNVKNMKKILDELEHP